MKPSSINMCTINTFKSQSPTSIPEIGAQPLINPIDTQQWKQFLDTIPTVVWTSTFKSKTHINVAKNKFPMVSLDKENTNKSTATKQYKSKMYSLSTWEITKLYSLGDPTLPENQGGISYENVCRYIHNSGRTDIKKPCPPIFFYDIDNGNNYSVALRRIYWHINLSK